MGRYGDVVRARDGVGVPLLLEWKLRVTRCRKVRAHLARLGSGRHSCSVHFQHGTTSICLCDILLKNRRRS